ncbi:MAG: helix-turn-helix domain-containing protein [Clostridia bacterium]|nr:helix-turn-helix domain-containing protein [Clostridia bacterium]
MAKEASYPVRHLQQPCAVTFRSHEKGYFMPVHWHSYYEMEIVTDGEYEHITNGIRQEAGAGQVWIMSPLDRHSLRAVRDCRIINLSFSTNLLSGEVEQALTRSPAARLTVLPPKELDIIIRACRLLQSETESTDRAFRDVMISSLLNSLLITALRPHAKTESAAAPRTPQLMQTVAQILHTEYRTDLSLAGIAQTLHISVGHLGVLFKQTFGMNFNTYLNRIRLRHACDMLLASRMTMQEIAAECGYRSTEYFYYIFRKYMGTTPGEYRDGPSAP